MAISESLPGLNVVRMTGTAHQSWLPDVASASMWERKVAIALAGYSAETAVSTASLSHSR